MKYLENEHDLLPPDFEDRVVDLNVLIEFLIVAEQELNKHENHITATGYHSNNCVL